MHESLGGSEREAELCHTLCSWGDMELCVEKSRTWTGSAGAKCLWSGRRRTPSLRVFS